MNDDRLVGVNGSGVSVNYSYNGLGDRLSETANGVPKQYTMDLNAGLTQVLQDGTNTYLYGNGRIAQYGASGADYFLGDALGSVRQVVDAEGNLTLGRKYEPYGEVLVEAGNGATSYGFTGEWTDGSTGDVYLRARWYAPGEGRFLTKDVREGEYNRPLSLNEWIYVEGNPVNYKDPSGNIRIPCPAGWNDQAVKLRVNEAERYVHHNMNTSDPMDTYVAAGIAIQCAGLDNPLNPNSGLGIAQVSQNQAETEWGQPIYQYDIWGNQVYKKDTAGNIEYDMNGNPIPVIRGYGIRRRCPDGDLEEALDPMNNEDAVVLMKRRIQLVIDECKGKKACTDTDKYIAAALAQNGPGFTHINMQSVIVIESTRKKLYEHPDQINRDWFLYFTNDKLNNPKMENTLVQLNRFDRVIAELRRRRWIIPILDYADIETLKNWLVHK